MSQHERTHLAFVHPSTKDLAWAAGFLEGEGCFYRASPPKRGNYIQVPQLNPDPLYKLLLLFGGSVRRRQKRPDVWVWSACGARARGIMITLYTFMSNVRKTQIEKALCG